jgi:hypothetical protein
MSNTAQNTERCEGDNNYPLCIALKRLDELELIGYHNHKKTGIVFKETVVELLQQFELDMIEYYGGTTPEEDEILKEIK